MANKNGTRHKNSFDIANILRKDMEKQIIKVFICFELQRNNTIKLYSVYK